MEKETSHRELDELRAELERHKKGTDAETELSKVQQNYTIMKEAYAKMRGEHLELIRSVSLFFSGSLYLCCLIISFHVLFSWNKCIGKEREQFYRECIQGSNVASKDPFKRQEEFLFLIQAESIFRIQGRRAETSKNFVQPSFFGDFDSRSVFS
jgi:hypothetical protein